MKRLTFFVAFLFSGNLGATAKDAFQYIRPMIFQVKTSLSSTSGKSSYGTGFVVDRAGLLVTNYHVVAESIWRKSNNRIFVDIDGTPKEAEILAVDFVNDLALLKVSHQFKSQIEFADRPPVQGAGIYSIGLPEDVGWTVVFGVYNGVIKQGPYELMHMSIPLNPGMSGGPTVNERNQLVAVNVSGLKLAQLISFGVPAKYVKTLIQNAQGKSALTPDQFLAQLKEQLTKLQMKITEEILDGFKRKKRIDGWTLPSFATSIRCWGGASEDTEQAKFISQVETCVIDQSVRLSGTGYTGTLRVEYSIYKNKKLNVLAWQNVKKFGWNYNPEMATEFNGKSKINFDIPKCIRERVWIDDANPRTVSICLQEIMPIKDLYDAYVNIHIPLNGEAFINAKLMLAGFSKENIRSIVQAATTLAYEGAQK